MNDFLVWIIFFGVLGYGLYRAATAPPPEPNPHLTCPHCQVKGQVVPTQRVRKRGISGGKATGALLTMGVSMIGTGLSRKQVFTHMDCRNCGIGWDVA